MENNDSTGNEFLEYASGIVQLAYEADYDSSTIFNGLAIATAAMIMDSVDEGTDKIDSQLLADVVEKFKETLNSAVKFAREQLEAGLLISESEE
jgi:hypothetical protein